MTKQEFKRKYSKYRGALQVAYFDAGIKKWFKILNSNPVFREMYLEWPKRYTHI